MESDRNMLLIYLMDRFVWMLLITVFTTAVLQQCGVVAVSELKHSTAVPMIEETFKFEMEPDSKFFDYAIRQKRQNQNNITPENDSIFNIPIATLSAVNKYMEPTGRRNRSHPRFQQHHSATLLHQSSPRSVKTHPHGQYPQRSPNYHRQEPSRLPTRRFSFN